jgi:sec-independent protein translocase protein TatC
VAKKSPKEMSFLDHLEELRWHIVRALIAIGVFSVTAFLLKDIVFGHVILGPSRLDFVTYRLLCEWSEKLNSTALCITQLPFVIQSRQMAGQFSMHVTSSFVIGLILAFPYAFWEIWGFVSPGLYFNEKKIARGATFFVSLLFMIGVLFGYFVIAPLSINFLSNYQVDSSVINQFDITSYVTTLAMLVLACAFVFQLPMVVYFLTKAGLVNPKLMRSFRRHAIVVILVLGALITPPDPFSQILVSVPLYGLYEISIYISAIVMRRRKKKEELEKI